ncbi:hypothetical protein Tco_1424815, partial [Tanacetum coccineum]
DTSNEVRESLDAPMVEKLLSDDKLEKKIVFPTVVKIEFFRPKQQEKPVKYAEMYRLTTITIKGKGNMVPIAFLMKNGLKAVNTASQKVNIAKGKFYTAMPKAVNTTRLNSAVVNVVRANQGHLQKEDQGYVDSRCSRHMIGNMSYLSDLKEFDGGYVTFGGGAKGGKITSKGTLKTSKLDFEDATAKAKTVNEEVQIQALVDGKKVIVTETSVRRALQLKDAEGIECLPNATIFAELERMGVTPLFETMMVEAPEELGEGLEIPTDPQHTHTIIQPSTSQPQKKQSRRKQRKDTEVPQPSGSTELITDEAANEEHVPVHSNDPLLSGEDRLKLNKLMELCTNLSQRVLDLENTKSSQSAEITKLK